MTTPTQSIETPSANPTALAGPNSSLGSLYEADETAWLDRMAKLVAERRFNEMDSSNLAEFLTDMAKRDRREVFSRLVVLLSHLLKWSHHEDHRSSSWRATIRTQRLELRQFFESASLLRHAAAELAKAYAEARIAAAEELDTDVNAFPSESPWTVQTASNQEL
ncbi:MAG: DUF29 domain-containing protein [Gemmataceae bacterium]|nr:DUF29 domain-containing protein [Gemmataceae bacterium]